MVKTENRDMMVIFGSHCRGMNVLPSIAPFKWKPGGAGRGFLHKNTSWESADLLVGELAIWPEYLMLVQIGKK